MIVECERPYWAIAASVPRDLTMASGVSAHGEVEIKGDK
jgi:hypothetical protein